nr:hypothetical protein [uncultured Butyrivibrio sp.]
MERFLKTKDSTIAGKITEIDGVIFITCTSDIPVYLNSKLLNPTNHFGKVRPYMFNDNDILTFGE